MYPRNKPQDRPQLPHEYFVVQPDGLKLARPYRGDGKHDFDAEQLRAAYPHIAEETIAFQAAGRFANVTIDQVQPRIVRLRSSLGCYSDARHRTKLLYGHTLGREPKDYSRQLHLLSPTSYQSVVAHDERRRPLTNEQLQAREARGPTQWKYWYLRSENRWFVAPVKDGAAKPPAPALQVPKAPHKAML